MPKETEDFFGGKRTWSRIKDQVLGSYLPPYLSKVSRLNKPILIVDGYAGPGRFDDGSPGSPLIICSTASKHAKVPYTALFFNNEKPYHDKLLKILELQGCSDHAEPILGDTKLILPKLPSLLRDQTVFLYLDPFGPTGSPFSLLEPFLTRSKAHSTEIVIMMHMPAAHRLASRNAVLNGREMEPHIQANHAILDEVFGGNYWKDVLIYEGDPTKEKERREYLLIDAYRKKLAEHLPFTGGCPVREGPKRAIKYFIVFASRHIDSMLLMNDAMLTAYEKHMHLKTYQGTLFGDVNWKDFRSQAGLEQAIVQVVTQNPGHTRKHVWRMIVQQCFMCYLESEYKKSVNELVKQGILQTPSKHQKGRLNDDCVLYLSG